MTTDQKGTTQMTKTSNLTPFTYHTTLPDGTVRTIKAATRRYTHSVVVQYGDLPDTYNAETHPAAGAWAVYSYHSTEALAAKAAAKVAKDRVIHSGAVITGADGGQYRSYTDVRVVPMDNLRPEDMPEPTPEPEPQVCWCGRPVVTRANGCLVHADQSPDARDDHGADVRALDDDFTAEQADEDPDHLEDQAARLRERVDHIEQRYVEVRAEAMDAKGHIVGLQDALERVRHERDVLQRALSDESADHSRQAQALMAEVSDAQRQLENAKAEAECLRDQRDAKGARLERYQRRLAETQAVAIDLGWDLLRASDYDQANQDIDARLGKVGLRLTIQHGLPDEYADQAANPYEATDETMVGLGEIDGSGE